MKAIYKVWSVENPETVYYFNDFSEVENKVNEIQQTGAFASWDFVDDSEEPTTPAPAEPSELTHAGQCLDIYLNNTSDIYERYTLPTIAAFAKSVGPRVNWEHVINDLCALNPFTPSSTVDGMIYRAIDKARRLVNQFDGLKPTDTDLQQVTRNYAEYIADCAKSEILEAAAL